MKPRAGCVCEILQTGEDRWVKYPMTRDDQESLFTRDVFPGYAFLPGGKEIVYNQNGKIRRLNIASGTETVIPFTAQVSQELGPKLDFPQKRRAGPCEGAVDPGSGGIAGRQEIGVFRDDSPLRYGYSRAASRND